MLAGALVLGPEVLWLVLGLGPWATHLVWGAVVLVAIGLHFAGRDLQRPGDLSSARADIHPAGPLVTQVWPSGA
jgi:hypothetical protein